MVRSALIWLDMGRYRLSWLDLALACPRCMSYVFYVALKALGGLTVHFVHENSWALLAGLPQVGRLHVEILMFFSVRVVCV